MSPRCPRCSKPTGICVCDRVVPMRVRTRVLVLQHPLERDEVLGTTRLLEQVLTDRIWVATGTSWGGLQEALGEPAREDDWAVLWRGQPPRPLTDAEEAAPHLILDRRGAPRALPWTGLIVLDGTWAQARTLWWRNPWLRRLGRVLLRPTEASIYGRVRREPRREAVSTLEAVADALQVNGEAPEVRVALRRLLRTMVQRARDTAPPGL